MAGGIRIDENGFEIGGEPPAPDLFDDDDFFGCVHFGQKLVGFVLIAAVADAGLDVLKVPGGDVEGGEFRMQGFGM